MRLAALLLAIAYSLPSWSQGILFAEIPYSLTSQQSVTVTHLSLGETCHVIFLPGHLVPCNPAFLPIDADKTERDSFLNGNIYLGDDYSKITEYFKILNNEDKAELAERFLNEKDPIAMQASTSLWMKSSWFSATFTPYKISYFSVVRDQADPQVALHALQEHSIAVQVGDEFADGFFAGLQVRGVKRKFIHQEFPVLEAVTDPEHVLEIQDQHVLYLEPGVGYSVPVDWRPRLSVNLINGGFADKNFEAFNTDPILDTGVGFSPPLGWPRLDLGVNYRPISQAEMAGERLRFGALLEFGVVSTSLGWDASNLSISVNSKFDKIGVGLMYTRNRISDPYFESYDNDAVYTEFSLLL